MVGASTPRMEGVTKGNGGRVCNWGSVSFPPSKEEATKASGLMVPGMEQVHR